MNEKDGEFKLYKKGFGWKRFNRLLKLQRKYRVIPNRPGWEQTPDGIMPPPTPSPASVLALLPYSLSVSDDDVIVKYGYTKCRNEDSGYSRTATGMTEAGGYTVVSPSDEDWICLKLEIQYPNVAIELTIDVTNGANPPDDVAPVSGGANGSYYLPLGQVTVDGSDVSVTSLASSHFIFDVACDAMAIWGRL